MVALAVLARLLEPDADVALVLVLLADLAARDVERVDQLPQLAGLLVGQVERAELVRRIVVRVADPHRAAGDPDLPLVLLGLVRHEVEAPPVGLAAIDVAGLALALDVLAAGCGAA